MKNSIFLSFIVALIVINLAFFDSILVAFYVVSDVLWFSGFDLGCVIFGVLFGVLFLALFIYFILKRDRKNMVCPVELKCPDDLTPLELGFLVDGVVDSQDLSSLLVYWASKGFITISKDGKTLKRVVEKLPENSNKYEQNIFNKIFVDDKNIVADDISKRLSGTAVVESAVSTVQNSIGKQYFDNKVIYFRQIFIVLFALFNYLTIMFFRLEYYVDVFPIVEGYAIASSILIVIASWWHLTYYDYRHKNNKKVGKIISFVFLILLFAAIIGLDCYFFWTDLYQVIFLVIMSVVIFLAILMCRNLQIYSKDGVKKLGQVLGFKQFLEVAEKDRIVMLAEQNPQLYYDVLPYAFVLGVSDKWIEKLEVIKQEGTMIDENVLTNIIIFNTFFRHTNLNFVTLVNVSTLSKVASHISFGSNGGRGGSVGGSNFGGFRRR